MIQLENRRYEAAEELPGGARETVIRLMTQDLLVGSPKGLGLTGDMVRLLVTADRASAFDE